MGKYQYKVTSYSQTNGSGEHLNKDEDNFYSASDGVLMYIRSIRNYFQRRGRRFTRFSVILFSAICLCFFLYLYIPLMNIIHGRSRPIKGWDFNTSKETIQYLLPDKDTTLENPRGICVNNLFLLIVVTSSIKNVANRMAIRETWGNTTEFNYPFFVGMHSHNQVYLKAKEMIVRMYSDYLNLQIPTNTSNLTQIINKTSIPVKVVFLIGRQSPSVPVNNLDKVLIKVEAEEYGDIIQEDFIDTYNNLTIKSLMMLKWINRNCLDKVKFILKCDDDAYVNVPNLLHLLLGGTIPVYKDTLSFYDAKTVNALAPSNRMMKTHDLLFGNVFCDVKPISDISSKWYAPYYMYAGDKYPTYVSGSAYLMTTDVANKLYIASFNVSLFHLEDVYLTGLCASKINLKRKHTPLFLYNRSRKKCVFKGILTVHYLNDEDMREYHNFVLNTTVKCPKLEKYFRINRLQTRSKNCIETIY